MLKKTQKIKLIKVCKVLFPKYKHVRIDNIRQVAILYYCSIPIIQNFFPKRKITLTELIGVQIPSQLADFKYGNRTFISVIQEDLVRCELIKKSKIDYFYEEVVKIKYADIYKVLNVTPEAVNFTSTSDEENKMFEEMVEYHKCKKERKVQIIPNIRSYWVSRETSFYILLLLVMLYVLLSQLKL